jgi:peroxiredoxin
MSNPPLDDRDLHTLPDGLPVPADDGAANHLLGTDIPAVSLPATTGQAVDLAAASRRLLVVYVYPRTGRPGEPSPPGWDDIPGARGCTPQSCAFRDHADEVAARGATLMGLSAQSEDDQREFARRERIPYPLLSDFDLVLAREMGLPTFEVAGMTLYRRLTFVASEGRIERVIYPVFPPDRNAADVLAWLDRP